MYQGDDFSAWPAQWPRGQGRIGPRAARSTLAASSAVDRHAPCARPAGCPTAWRDLFPFVRFRTLATGPDTLITSLCFARGATAPLHRHDSTQAGYVLSGRVRVTTPDEQYVIEAGESYVIPAGVPHQIRALADTTVVDTFTRGAGSARPRLPLNPGISPVR